mmetsp:Transcript_34691/g.79481  ORF Transcript_34691/g.79481 Transcript_34691/m.79481 type:complete len:936 (+) Transcript_34691:74-2881(+)
MQALNGLALSLDIGGGEAKHAEHINGKSKDSKPVRTHLRGSLGPVSKVLSKDLATFEPVVLNGHSRRDDYSPGPGQQRASASSLPPSYASSKTSQDDNDSPRPGSRTASKHFYRTGCRRNASQPPPCDSSTTTQTSSIRGSPDVNGDVPSEGDLSMGLPMVNVIPPPSPPAHQGTEAWTSVARSLSLLAESVKSWQEQMVVMNHKAQRMHDLQQSMLQQHLRRTEEVMKRELNLHYGDMRHMMVDVGWWGDKDRGGEGDGPRRLGSLGAETRSASTQTNFTRPRRSSRVSAESNAASVNAASGKVYDFHRMSMQGNGAKELAECIQLESVQNHTGEGGVVHNVWTELRNNHKHNSSGQLSSTAKDNGKPVKKDSSGSKSWGNGSGAKKRDMGRLPSKETGGYSISMQDHHSSRNQKLQEFERKNSDDSSVTSNEWRAMLKEVEAQQLRDRLPKVGAIYKLCLDLHVPREQLPDTSRVSYGKLERFVAGDCFMFASMFAIILNAIFVGIEADNSIKTALSGVDANSSYININRFFVAFFSCELILKVTGQGAWFVFGQDGLWNLLDVLIVGSSIYWETQDTGGGGSSSSARIARVLRLARVGRVLRQSSLFHELRVMAAALLEACSTLAWGAMALLLVMYIFAVFLLQGAATYIQENDELRIMDTTMADNPVVAIRDWYGSLSDTMFTLFYAITGGKPWTELLDPFLPITQAYRFAFVAYVVLAALGVLKLFSAVFVVSIMHMEERDHCAIIHQQMAQDNAFIHGLSDLIRETDGKRDTRTVLSGWWLQGFLRDQRVQAFFAAFQLDWRAVSRFFEAVQKGNHSISLDDFVLDCTRLRGSARNFDVVCLQKDIIHVGKSLHELIDLIQDCASGDDDGYASPYGSKRLHSESPSLEGAPYGESGLDRVVAENVSVRPTAPTAPPATFPWSDGEQAIV